MNKRTINAESFVREYGPLGERYYRLLKRYAAARRVSDQRRKKIEEQDAIIADLRVRLLDKEGTIRALVGPNVH